MVILKEILMCQMIKLYYIINEYSEKLDDSYYVSITLSYPYLNDEVIQTNVRVHFIKHF